METPRPEPIYTPDNCSTAYQLDWSVTLFWRQIPATDEWLVELMPVTEADGVRVLRHRFPTPDCSQFLISSKPGVRPVDVVRSLKGRLQYLVRQRWPKAFQRNYDLHSIGSTRREKLEEYVASQLPHHGVEGTTKTELSDLQVCNPEIDLSRPRFSAHARYRCNLHLAFVTDRRRQFAVERLEQIRSMIRRCAATHGDLLARVGLLPDHLHLVLGVSPEEAPLNIALRYMNNIAFVVGMEPVLMHSCYLGTVGEYDLGAAK